MKINYGIEGHGSMSFEWPGDFEDHDGIIRAIRAIHSDIPRLHIVGYAAAPTTIKPYPWEGEKAEG